MTSHASELPLAEGTHTAPTIVELVDIIMREEPPGSGERLAIQCRELEPDDAYQMVVMRLNWEDGSSEPLGQLLKPLANRGRLQEQAKLLQMAIAANRWGDVFDTSTPSAR